MKIAVLVQGLADRIEAFIAENPWLDAEQTYALAYDRPLAESAQCVAFFDSACSWAEGRNTLLNEAQGRCAYDGFVFMDDDVGYVRGSFRLFYAYCVENPTFFIVPITEKVGYSGGILPTDYQRTLLFDDQMYYLPRHILESSNCYPMFTRYDHLSWFIPCEVFHRIILQYHWKQTLQINRISISNELHRRYTPQSNYRLSPDFLDYVDAYVRESGMRSFWYQTYYRAPETGRLATSLWKAFRYWRRRRAPIPASKVVEPRSLPAT